MIKRLWNSIWFFLKDEKGQVTGSNGLADFILIAILITLIVIFRVPLEHAIQVLSQEVQHQK